MPNQATLSIAGLYSWDSHIFDLLQLPSQVNRQNIIDNILLECAELTVIYPDWNFMQSAIGKWSAKELEIWQKVYDLEHMDYNPIENYDRYEDELENIGNKGKTLQVGSSEVTNSTTQNTDTVNRVAGFNTDTLANQSQAETNDMNIGRGGNAATDMSYSNNDQTRSRGSRIHGNVGVTTSQQMLMAEFELRPKIHVDDYIINSFNYTIRIFVINLEI
jgi:hypothetical protein